MAYQQWGTGGLAKEGQLTTFDKRLLNRFRGNIILSKMGFQRGIPVNGGKSISFRRMEAILGASYAAAYNSGGAYASGPAILTEGTPGPALDFTVTEILATVAQYGMYSIITDLAENQSIDQIVPELVEDYGEAMAEAIELVTRDILTGGTNVQYASTGGSRGGVGSGMNLVLKELRTAKRTLLKHNAKGVKSEDQKFVLYTHPDCLFDLEGDANITNIWQYAGERGNGNQLFDVVFRDLPFGVRVYESSLCTVFASLGLSGADVYGNLMFGDEWFGTIDLDALPARVIRKDVGSSGILDPLDQAGSVGWKCAYAAVILNQNLGVRIESSSSNSAH
ncbi:MAG TPA: N4-gp56 family major capsid protein [Arthrobacter sp.]|nr:N4-gp56 family major capsid protein [Arthrobacter sp.]